MVWFVYGNVSKDSAIATIEMAETILNLKRVSKESLVDIRTIDIPPAKIHRVDFPVEDTNNGNSCFVSIFQFGLLGNSQ